MSGTHNGKIVASHPSSSYRRTSHGPRMTLTGIDIHTSTTILPVQIVYGRSCRGNCNDRGRTQVYYTASALYRDFIRILPHVARALQRATVRWDRDLQDSYTLLESDEPRKHQRKNLIAENSRRIMDPKCAYVDCCFTILKLLPDQSPSPPS